MTRVLAVAAVALCCLVGLHLMAGSAPAAVLDARTMLYQVTHTRLPQPNWNCLPPKPGWTTCAQ